jgi:hypothetical protein
VDTTTFDAHGVTFTVSSPDADMVAAFDDLLVDFGSGGVSQEPPSIRFAVEATRPDGTAETWYRVTAGDDIVYTSLLEGSLVSHLLMDVNARAAAACRNDATVPLHAGTVAGAFGAVVLPGASHSGKTTITTALSAAGHRFVADEVSRLDPEQLTIAPYGKPVALRSASVELLAPTIARLRRPGSRFEIDERFVPPSELGPSTTGGATAPTRGVAARPVEVSAIVFPRYDAAGPHRFAPLGPAETLERLMQCTLGVASTPVGADVFRILERLVRAVPGHELVYTELHAALDELVPLMADPGDPPRAK